MRDFDLRIADITLAHRQEAPGGYTWNAYSAGRKVWGVTYVASGCAVLVYKDGTENRISAGETAIIPASAAYRFLVPSDMESCLHYTINFELSGEPNDWADSERAYVARAGNPTRFEKNFEESILFWMRKQPGYKMRALSRLYEITYDIMLARMQGEMPAAAYNQVLPAQTYITEHYQNDIDINKLAGFCNLSVTHFRRLFKAAFNTTPIVYLQNVRLEHAKDLLQIPDNTVDAVALLAGFQSGNYFIRAFKQHTGMTPLQYRKTC